MQLRIFCLLGLLAPGCGGGVVWGVGPPGTFKFHEYRCPAQDYPSCNNWVLRRVQVSKVLSTLYVLSLILPLGFIRIPNLLVGRWLHIIEQVKVLTAITFLLWHYVISTSGYQELYGSSIDSMSYYQICIKKPGSIGYALQWLVERCRLAGPIRLNSITYVQLQVSLPSTDSKNGVGYTVFSEVAAMSTTLPWNVLFELVVLDVKEDWWQV